MKPSGSRSKQQCCFLATWNIPCLTLTLYSVHDGESADITSDEVAAFIKALEAHFFHHFKIHLSGLSLSRIGTPLVYIGSEGRLKILSETAVHGVLQHITELAMDNFWSHLGASGMLNVEKNSDGSTQQVGETKDNWVILTYQYCTQRMLTEFWPAPF